MGLELRVRSVLKKPSMVEKLARTSTSSKAKDRITTRLPFLSSELESELIKLPHIIPYITRSEEFRL